MVHLDNYREYIDEAVMEEEHRESFVKPSVRVLASITGKDVRDISTFNAFLWIWGWMRQCQVRRGERESSEPRQR